MSLAISAPGLSSYELCDLLGISYRQLDYLCRTTLRGLGHFEPGSGARRRFDPEIVDRLVIARKIHEAMPFGLVNRDNSVWPMVAAAVVAGPQPLREGFVTMNAVGLVRYFEHLDWGDIEVGTLVVPYRLD